MQYQRPESPSVTLLIDQGKYFAFTCDDIVLHQSDIRLMDSWSSDAGFQMKIAIDRVVLAGLVAQANASNLGASAGRVSGNINLGAGTLGASSGTPLQLTKENILDVLVDCRTVLEEQNVPTDEMWMILPMWAIGKILKSDLKDASLTGDGKSALRTGMIGSINNFNIYGSNLLTSQADTSAPSGSSWFSFFGHRSALTFAAQLVKMESLRAESTFGDLIRGLNVFGFKVLKTAAMGQLYICP